MAKLIIEIDTDNATFQDPCSDRHMDNIMARAAECSRILRELTEEEGGFINNGYLSGAIRDINGNHVGTWSFQDE